MGKKKTQISFSHKYEKIGKQMMTTVRWLDSIYELGKVYEAVLIAKNLFHNRYVKGEYRLVKMEIVKLKDLTDEFIRQDADCDREAFMSLMRNWYEKKKDWKGEDSEVQVLYLWKQGEHDQTTIAQSW